MSSPSPRPAPRPGAPVPLGAPPADVGGGPPPHPRHVTAFLQGGGAEAWLQAIGVTPAPVTRAGLANALRFFHARMPGLPRAMQVSFLKGMDLHHAVEEVLLPPGTVVVAFRKCNEDPFRLFHTTVGASVHALGVNPHTREFRRYRVVRPVHALQSRCAAARDTWTAGREYVASGGGRQLIIPDSFSVLQLQR